MGLPDLNRPEISDLVVDYDPATLARLDVRRDAVLAKLEEHRMGTAIAIVSGWPHQGGILDRAFVDGVLLRSHMELQRLSEEFQQGPRMKRLLVPVLDTLEASGKKPPFRVVDLGCGTGYVVRWLAAKGELGERVTLVGCDYNTPLVDMAARLAEAEGLGCMFRRANAFELEEPADVFLSTGVIHHFRGAALEAIFAEQDASPCLAVVHCDIKPSLLAPLGAWVFHRARMREPLARYDGTLSAIRAHAGSTLLEAARRACPDWTFAVFDGTPEAFPLLRVMQALVGLRGDGWSELERRLGSLAARLDTRC